MSQNYTIHSQNTRITDPILSIVLLDWSVREYFQALHWLTTQDVPRTQYELIWIEVYDRLVPEALKFADVVITCHQKGMYHKHEAYNIGLLNARGMLVTVCDSDAVFPTNFVSSVFENFDLSRGPDGRSIFLMHHEWRTKVVYPSDLKDFHQLQHYQWHEEVPNSGACMTVRRRDAIRFGGFDEHHSFRGYMCGPYDLAWRLVNAGFREQWVDQDACALWHFAHENPVGYNYLFSPKLYREIINIHIDGHAVEAVDAFSTGRIQPLTENSEIFALRMKSRQIGTPFEENLARRFYPQGIPATERMILRLLLWLEPVKRRVRRSEVAFGVFRSVRLVFRRLQLVIMRPPRQRIGPIQLLLVNDNRSMTVALSKTQPVLIRDGYRGFNIVLFKGQYFAIARTEGAFDHSRFQAGGYARCFAANSVAEAYQAIDESVRHNRPVTGSKYGTRFVRKSIRKSTEGFQIFRNKLLQFMPANVKSRSKNSAYDNRSVIVALSETQPFLIRDGYRGFNIVLFKGQYFAIARTEGAFDHGRFQAGGYARCFAANSVAEAYQAIDESVRHHQRETGSKDRTGLVRRSIKKATETGSKYGTRFVRNSIQKGTEGFQIFRNKLLQFMPAIVRSRSKNSVYDNRSINVELSQTKPLLIRDGYRGFNIVLFKGQYFAIARTEGAFDHGRFQAGGYALCFAVNSVAEAYQVIDESAHHHQPGGVRKMIKRVLRATPHRIVRVQSDMNETPPK